MYNGKCDDAVSQLLLVLVLSLIVSSHLTVVLSRRGQCDSHRRVSQQQRQRCHHTDGSWVVHTRISFNG
jgi:hypothetical protein